MILIEVPDEVGGYGAKGVGDGIRRYRLPMDDAPAARPSIPKSRRRG